MGSGRVRCGYAVLHVHKVRETRTTGTSSERPRMTRCFADADPIVFSSGLTEDAVMFRRVFLGTGLLGSGLAEAAAARGDEVRAWNRTPERAQPLEAHGITVCESPTEAIYEADYVHIVLTNDDAVDAVIESILPSLDPSQKLIDHSTTSPSGTAARHARLAKAGHRLLHAPVFMSPAAARVAGGTMIVAGAKADYNAAQEALAPMAESVEHVGERPDAAAALKLFGNAMNLSMLSGLADIFAMAKGLGFTPDDAMRVFDLIDVRYVLQGRGRRMSRGDFSPLWTVDIAKKDVGLMQQCAGEVPQHTLPGIYERLGKLQKRGAGLSDVGVIAADALGASIHADDD